MTALHALGLLALTGCVGLASTAGPAPTDGEARIEIDRQPDRYRISALYDGPARDGLTYRLEVEREGQGGRSRSSQGGAVHGDTLATSAVNVAPGDRLLVRLTINDGETVVAADSVDETVAP